MTMIPRFQLLLSRINSHHGQQCVLYNLGKTFPLQNPSHPVMATFSTTQCIERTKPRLWKENCIHVSQFKVDVMQRVWKDFRRFSSTKEVTVEKKLRHFMDMWEMEKAVQLLRDSVDDGVLPHQNIVLNLLQQLANLGETECLLDLHEFLTEKKLVTDAKFFNALKDAYYYSGRLDEGVGVLRILFHRTRKFRNVEIFFCLLAVMVIRHFPHRIDLIEGFVTDLKEFQTPVIEPVASLWKCYILTGMFEKADQVLAENEEIKSHIPQMVSDICSRYNKIEADYDTVLHHLKDSPLISARLRTALFTEHAEVLCSLDKHDEAMDVLSEAMTQGMTPATGRLTIILTQLMERVQDKDKSDRLASLLQWCDQLEGAK
ncbi:uncharacterized protein LOC124138948 [Haliotis rufescens]|uniref:uncharacterized protein LOC124138948 n=1 Tax=Haliotis rufescens TaxID=6454 RepID=UPI00201EA585|nr:uncharacterized protein LOC124138948 [Haliotis rufescens]